MGFQNILLLSWTVQVCDSQARRPASTFHAFKLHIFQTPYWHFWNIVLHHSTFILNKLKAIKSLYKQLLVIRELRYACSGRKIELLLPTSLKSTSLTQLAETEHLVPSPGVRRGITSKTKMNSLCSGSRGYKSSIKYQ